MVWIVGATIGSGIIDDPHRPEFCVILGTDHFTKTSRLEGGYWLASADRPKGEALEVTKENMAAIREKLSLAPKVELREDADRLADEILQLKALTPRRIESVRLEDEARK